MVIRLYKSQPRSVFIPERIECAGASVIKSHKEPLRHPFARMHWLRCRTRHFTSFALSIIGSALTELEATGDLQVRRIGNSYHSEALEVAGVADGEVERRGVVVGGQNSVWGRGMKIHLRRKDDWCGRKEIFHGIVFMGVCADMKICRQFMRTTAIKRISVLTQQA